MTPELRARLIGLREAAGLSQRRVALTIGITPGSMSRIEAGKNDPSVSTLEQIAETCGSAVVLPSPDAARAVVAIDRLTAEDLEMVLRLARALPLLDAPTRESAAGFLAFLDRATTPAVHDLQGGERGETTKRREGLR